MNLDTLVNKQKEVAVLTNKLKSSLKLESIINIDWNKGSVKRMVQTKYLGGRQQIYKSWLQQGSGERRYLSAEEYSALTGSQLNQHQIYNWSIL